MMWILCLDVHFKNAFYLSVNAVFSTNIEEPVFVSTWKTGPHFMWSSESWQSREAVSLFLSYFKTLSIGPVLEHSTSCSVVKCSTYLARSAYHTPPATTN